MNTATEKQIDLINRLKTERIVEDPELLEAARQAWRKDGFTVGLASHLISQMMEWPLAAQTTPAPEGMHRFDDTIYKVQKSPESGRKYAKQLSILHVGGADCVHTDPGSCYEAKFHYAAGAMRNLSEDTLLTLDEAKEFGALYGTCMVCGRTLTDEGSIEAGIGPVCAKKF